MALSLPIGRFAPSPTGVLHLGNLRTALASWLSVRAQGGSWVLRMEDVDLVRSRRELGEAQIRDLAALGLESDAPILWQSQRGPIYQAALERLGRGDRLYTCTCTRRDLALLAAAPHDSDGLRPYPGHCRSAARNGGDRPLAKLVLPPLSPAPFKALDGALRFRLPEGEVAWVDRLLGPQRDDPGDWTGDPLLFRRDGCFAYHLAVVVDDGGQGVSEVVRGADLRGVTATQIRLQEALGLARPVYAHLGLVTSPDGTRLGKRAGALGVPALAAKGIDTKAILGWLGWSLGCQEAPEPCRAEDLVAGFAWPQVPKASVAIPAAWAQAS